MNVLCLSLEETVIIPPFISFQFRVGHGLGPAVDPAVRAPRRRALLGVARRDQRAVLRLRGGQVRGHLRG